METPRRSPVLLAVGIFLVLTSSLLPGGAQSVIMPGVAAELNGLAYYSLTFVVSTLATAVFTPVAAKISQYWGYQRVIRAGLVLILLSSVAIPLCPAMVWVVVFRFLSGVGASMITSPGLALIGTLFPVDQRVRWMGYYGMLSSACNGFGPILGGLCADLLGWRWVYFSALPFGLAGLYLLFRHAMPEQPDGVQSHSSFDLRGLLLLAAAMSAMTALCQLGGSVFPWISLPTAGLFLLTLMLFGCFVFAEYRQGQNALLPLSLYRFPVFVSSSLACFLTTASAIATFTYLPLCLQSHLGMSPSRSAVVVTAEFLTAAAVSPLLGRIMARTNRFRAVSIGAAILMAVISIGYSRLSVDTPFPLILFSQVVYGLAAAAVTSVYLMTIQSQMPERQISAATAAMQLGQTIGGTVGAAALGAIASSASYAVSMPLLFQTAAVLALLAIPASLRLTGASS